MQIKITDFVLMKAPKCNGLKIESFLNGSWMNCIVFMAQWRLLLLLPPPKNYQLTPTKLPHCLYILVVQEVFLWHNWFSMVLWIHIPPFTIICMIWNACSQKYRNKTCQIWNPFGKLVKFWDPINHPKPAYLAARW